MIEDSSGRSGHEPGASAVPSPSVSGEQAETRILIGEERAVISKREVEHIGARLRLRTHEDEVPVAETLRQERIEIERIPVGRVVDVAPEVRVEDGVTIVPVVEEVLVRMFRIIEEVHLSVVAETVEHQDTVTLRRQEAIISENPSDSDPAPSEVE